MWNTDARGYRWFIDVASSEQLTILAYLEVLSLEIAFKIFAADLASRQPFKLRTMGALQMPGHVCQGTLTFRRSGETYGAFFVRASGRLIRLVPHYDVPVSDEKV